MHTELKTVQAQNMALRQYWVSRVKLSEMLIISPLATSAGTLY